MLQRVLIVQIWLRPFFPALLDHAQSSMRKLLQRLETTRPRSQIGISIAIQILNTWCNIIEIQIQNTSAAIVSKY